MDPANFLTAPSLAWDAMLIHTNVKLDFISNADILILIERMKRGGLCFVGSKSYLKTQTNTCQIMFQIKNQIIYSMRTLKLYMDVQCMSCLPDQCWLHHTHACVVFAICAVASVFCSFSFVCGSTRLRALLCWRLPCPSFVNLMADCACGRRLVCCPL